MGYGKPPRHTRFQKGQSGNPRGRPRGAEEPLDPVAVRRSTSRSIVTENGGRRKITKREAIITQLVNRSATADFRAIKILLDMRAGHRTSDRAGFCPRPPTSARRTKSSSNRSGRASRPGNPSNERPDPGRVRVPAAARLRHFRRTLLSRPQPADQLATNWHLEVIAAKLTAVRQGKIRRLIINLPPRHLKSLMASIAFPAWCLGHDPSAQFLCVSYAQDLADKLARDCRSIMISPWYQRIFPTRLAPHRQAVQEFLTTRQGYRLATSNGGVLTGRGADIILIDDPLKPEEALSAAQRKAANDWFDHTLYSRLNDKRHGAIVIIMQRLHEDDLVGHVLEQEPWEVVRFPAIAEVEEVHEIETIWGPRRFTAPPGRSLAPRSRAGRDPRPDPPHDRRIQLRRPVSAIPGPAGRRAGQGGLVQALSLRRAGQKASSASCKAGTPPTRRPSSAISRCARPGA